MARQMSASEAVGEFPRQLQDWWARRPIREQGRTIGRCTFFVTTIKETDASAEEGAGGLDEECEDEVEFAWPGVTGICGFSGVSCRWRWHVGKFVHGGSRGGIPSV